MKIAIHPTIPFSSHLQKFPHYQENSKDFDYLLTFDDNILKLFMLYDTKLKPIYVDFVEGALGFRRKTNNYGQLLAKALGLKQYSNPNVIDATAGLGADSFMMACMGCQMTMIERSEIIGALLDDGIKRIGQEVTLQTIAEKLTQLYIGDAKTLLKNLEADIIYLDPMYPERKKTALNKKEMRVLKDIVGEDEDADDLFIMAQKSNCKRIIVKRPRLAPFLNQCKPTLFFEGKSTRYDVYIKTRLA